MKKFYDFFKSCENIYKIFWTNKLRFQFVFSAPPYVISTHPWVHASEKATITLRCQFCFGDKFQDSRVRTTVSVVQYIISSFTDML